MKGGNKFAFDMIRHTAECLILDLGFKQGWNWHDFEAQRPFEVRESWVLRSLLAQLIEHLVGDVFPAEQHARLVENDIVLLRLGDLRHNLLDVVQ